MDLSVKPEKGLSAPIMSDNGGFDINENAVKEFDDLEDLIVADLMTKFNLTEDDFQDEEICSQFQQAVEKELEARKKQEQQRREEQQKEIAAKQQKARLEKIKALGLFVLEKQKQVDALQRHQVTGQDKEKKDLFQGAKAHHHGEILLENPKKSSNKTLTGQVFESSRTQKVKEGK